MTHIIAGHFGQQDQVQHVIEQLHDAGFSEENICSFYLNPAGQHDLYPIGGDRDKSPGAKESEHTMKRGAALGGVIGGAAGMAGVELAGPLAPAAGAFLGAHIGSLFGSLSGMKEAGEHEQSDEENASGENEVEENAAPQRMSGMIVAVSIDPTGDEESVVQILRESGADQIELADGNIANGDWEDFDPLSIPHLIQ